MKNIVWTYEMRKMLYASLLAEFGPHHTWHGSRYPTDRRTDFQGVLRKLAAAFSIVSGKEITPEAVEQQVDWGITVQKEMKSQGHVRNFILNKAAALEVGFVTTSDLPNFMTVRAAGGAKTRKEILDEL
jgi:hypothetical protein